MTLPRILEPEVMDTIEEAQEYNQMDHAEVNQQFVDDLLAFAKSTWRCDEDFELGDVLDLGTGTALIPVELCRRHEPCRVMAVDLATSMLDLAVFNVEVANLRERITLAHVDAKTMPHYQDKMFDTVMSNSIIHHIADPKSCVEQMVRVAADGGTIFVRDLMRPDDQATLDKLVQTYTGQETQRAQTLFRESLHASLMVSEMQEIVESFGFDADTVVATSDRHWTWSARTPQ